MKFNSESAVKAQAKGAETKRRRKEMTPEERASQAIADKLGRLTKELLDAALAEGDFAPHWVLPPEGSEGKPFYNPGLKPETRVSALLRAMEWRLGKAPTAPRPEAPREEAPPLSADDLFT